jgi:hypothetical protein
MAMLSLKAGKLQFTSHPSPTTPTFTLITAQTTTEPVINPEVFPLHAYTDADGEEFETLLARGILPDLTDDPSDPILPLHIQTTIQSHIKTYLKPKSPSDKSTARNALSFYLAFMKGHFRDHQNDAVVVRDGEYRVWGLGEGEEGERGVWEYEGFLDEGTFVCRGCGYWRGVYGRNRGWLEWKKENGSKIAKMRVKF